MSSITKFLPKNHLSYLVGKLVHAQFPKFIWSPVIWCFARYYKINLEETEKPINQYASLGDFFVRNLKPGLRPLGQAFLLNPADSKITQASPVTHGQMIQAKNKFYQVQDFLADSKAAQTYQNGFFVTYYLCPTDYHQVHSPVDGVIQKITHIPGQLWPVNQWSTENIEELFSINERVVVEIQTARGLLSVVFVGATNVGFIEIFKLPELKGNHLEVFKNKTWDNLSLSLKKGDKLGQFRMGSTVVLVAQASISNDYTQNTNILSQWVNQSVKVNSDFIN